MKRTLNWTGRKRIPLECLMIRLEKGVGGVPSFTAELSGLVDLKLDPSSRIYVEPYVKSSSMRFDFGTILAPSLPADTALYDLDVGADVLFRIRVVDESGDVGKILAAADGIRPINEVEDDDRKSLLPVAYKDLGEKIWDLEMQPGGSRPKLVLNNQIPELAEKIRFDHIFQGAIIPVAVEKILTAVYLNVEYDEDGSDWVADWKEFATAVRAGKEIGDEIEEDDLPDAIKDVIDRFASQTAWVRKHKIATEIVMGEIRNE